MKISTKGRYGLRAMIELAIYPTKSHISLNYIAERQNLSANYMERIFSTLRKADLVKSVKGAQGGYILAEAPSEITIGRILRALEGNLSLVEESGDHGTTENRLKDSLQINVWNKLTECLNNIVDSITLEDMVHEYIKMNETSDQEKDVYI